MINNIDEWRLKGGMQVVGVKNNINLVVCGHVRKLEFGGSKGSHRHAFLSSSHPSISRLQLQHKTSHILPSFLPIYLFIYYYYYIQTVSYHPIPTLMVSYLQTISLHYIFTIMPLNAWNLLLSNIILFSTSQVIHNQSLSLSLSLRHTERERERERFSSLWATQYGMFVATKQNQNPYIYNNNKLSLQQIVKESPQSYSIQYILHLYIYNA